MNFAPKLGIGGVPIGEGRGSEMQPKQEIPCSAFMNIQNKPVVLNNSKVLNSKTVLNVEKSSTFKSSTDILVLLKSHPDFIRVPPDVMEAMSAALYSALAIGAGIALTVLSGEVGAIIASPTLGRFVTLTLGTTLTSAGMAGAHNSIKGAISGNFTWKSWAQEFVLSGVTSLIVFPAAFGAGYRVSCLTADLHKSAARALFLDGTLANSVSRATSMVNHMVIKNMALATAAVYSVGQGTCDVIKDLVLTGKVNPISVVISLALGCWSGYSLGKQMTDASTRKLLNYYIDKLNAFFKDAANQGKQLNLKQIYGLLTNIDLLTHALSRHGPGAILSNHPSNKSPTISGFANLNEMLRSIQDAVSNSVPHVTYKGTRLEFTYQVQNIYINILNRQTGATQTNTLFSGTIKVIVDPGKAPGQLPTIVTVFPKL